MADKKIGGKEYKIGFIRTSDAILLKDEILQVLGQGALRLPDILAGMGEKNSEDSAKSNGQLIGAFTDIIMKNEAQKVLDLFKKIAGYATVKTPSGYEEVDLDIHFTNKELMSFYKVVFWVLKEIYGDFFTELRKIITSAIKAAEPYLKELSET